MDRRRLQIQNKVNEISEEKNLLQSNLEKIMEQISYCMDIVNNTRKLKQKECSLILKFELEVLKKLTEINFELESMIEESPTSRLEITDNFQNYSVVSVNAAKSETSNVSVAIEKELPRPPVLTHDFVVNDVAVAGSSALVEGTSETDFEVQSTFSDADIHVLRNTLKEFSEKLGLNLQSISSMADFYQKSSSNCVGDFSDVPSTSQNAICETGIIKLSLENETNGIEVPEKDTNRVVFPENGFTSNCIDNLELVDSSDSSDMVDTGASSSFNTPCNSTSVENFQTFVSLKPEPHKYTVDDSFSTDASFKNTNTTDSSNNAYVPNPANHCLIPLVDEHSNIIDNIIDEAHFKTEDNAKQTNEIVCTAVEKLNNTKFFDRQAEAVAKMQEVDQPDIKLMPTEHRIKNDFETVGTSKQTKKKKNKKAKCKDIEIYELLPKAAPETNMDCAFSHVESPSEFYVHLVDEESVLIDQLTDELNNKYNGTVSEYNSKEEAFGAIGTFCFCYVSSFASWYRARVLDWDLEGKLDDVVVQFVDYGDKKRISYKNLRRMTKEMANIPMLAIRCHLPLVYPPHSTHSCRLTEWPAATIDALMELSGLLVRGEERHKIFSIVYSNQEEESVAIDMYNLKESTEELTVGQILLDLGLAVPIEEEYDENHPELEAFLEDVDTLEIADNINEAVMGYDPRDEVRICRFSKADGTCYKGKNCKLEHVPMSKDGFTTDKMPVFKEAMYSLLLPAKGELVNILVTSYRDACNFLAQIIRMPRKEKDYMIDEDLYRLLAEMNAAKTVRTYETFKIPPAIGEIVITKHWSHKWLRAVVREEAMYNNNQVGYQVYTLDFGDYLTVPLCDLRKIKPHFLELPFQVVQCYLHKYVAKEDCKKKAQKFFYENLYYRNFVAHTMSACLPLKLSVTTFDGVDVGKMLVEKGFAKDRVNDLNPSDDCNFDLC